MNRIRSCTIVFAIILFLVSCLFCAHAAERNELKIVQDSSGKEGLQNELGEWIIPPLYDMISYNGDIYWVFFERDEGRTALMGLVDTKRGFAIPAHYDEILVGDELIVAYDPTTHVYDIFDQEWRLIYTLPSMYDYVLPNGADHIDVVDSEGNYYTIPIPSYLVTAD